ncbi:MAG: hypothetical protein LBQ51_10705 [Desulfovibrio sp.]|jgi:hypothetical protein|nr:hypothetical protein [Desulfovibrio sp.]
MMSAVTYKALEACRIGGQFRRAGEVFQIEELAETPAYLRKTGPAQAAKAPQTDAATRRPAQASKAPARGAANPSNSATLEDLGVKTD